MDDLIILDNLFKKQNDQILFELFKESNIIGVNNNNNGNFDKEVTFNTQSLASKIINYKDAYILLQIQVDNPYDSTDQGKNSVPKLVYLKKSYELVEYLKISLNNAIISNESNVNRSSLVNYVLNDAYNDPTSNRNISKAISIGLNITENQFMTKDTYQNPQDDDDDDTDNKFHYINFEIPVYLRDISEFFRNFDILKGAEFNINLRFINNMVISTRTGIKTNTKSCFLYVEEIRLHDEDNIRYLKMLNDGYTKFINFLENHTRIFNDKKSEIGENFYINNVRNADSVYMHGILDANKVGLNYDLPSAKFEEAYLNIDNIRFENSIPNDISAYKILKSKSNHYDNFLITYPNFKKYCRIYCWNVSRNIRDDHNNKFMNIVTNMESTSCTVYVVFKTFSTVKLEYNKNDGLVVYKTQ